MKTGCGSIQDDRKGRRARVMQGPRVLVYFPYARHGGRLEALQAAGAWLKAHPETPRRAAKLGRYVYRHNPGPGRPPAHEVHIRALGIRRRYYGPTAHAMAVRMAAVLIPMLASHEGRRPAYLAGVSELLESAGF
jgi:hypothetical protein